MRDYSKKEYPVSQPSLIGWDQGSYSLEVGFSSGTRFTTFHSSPNTIYDKLNRSFSIVPSLFLAISLLSYKKS